MAFNDPQSSISAVFERVGLQVFERGWLSSNSILFCKPGSGETVLVDTGYCSHAAQTLALVRESLGERRLDRIVNTHLHSDHCGGNNALQSVFSCSIDVPAGEAEVVDVWDQDRLSFVLTGQSCPRFERTGQLAADSEIALGDCGWQVIGASGHDPASVILYQRESKILISADALWRNGFGVVFPELDGIEAFSDVRRTLDRISMLEVAWVIPGHGEPFSDVNDALSRAYARLRAMTENPTRHAGHAARVLVKFHLLETRSEPLVDLLEWMSQTPIFGVIHDRYFGDQEQEAWHCAVVLDLCRQGAMGMESGVVWDI